jgi:phage shock protein A
MSDNEPIDAEIVEEPPTPAVVLPTDYSEAGVPTFEYVRDRIETKIAAADLDKESPKNLTVDQQLAERDRAGREKLEEIRRQLRGE